MNINELFPDEALAQMIERKFNFSKNPKKAIKLMEKEENLLIMYSNIENLEGLQMFKNLNFLYSQHNNIVDLKPLANLVKLKSLHLNNNNISEITPLANLSKLESLILGNNPINDVSAIRNLPNLKILYLGNTNVSKLSTISERKLDDLDLANSKINNFNCLSGMQNLRILYLENNSDLTTLPMLENLDSLVLGDSSSPNKLTNHRRNPKLSNLDKLNCFLKYKLDDYSFIENLPNLKAIQIYE